MTQDATAFASSFGWTLNSSCAHDKAKQAVNNTSPSVLETIIYELWKVIKAMPEESNTPLVEAARQLDGSLPTLVSNMVVVRDYWQTSNQDRMIASEVTSAISTLSKLSGLLKALADEHDLWQVIDDEEVKPVEEDMKQCTHNLKNLFIPLKNVPIICVKIVWLTGPTLQKS